MGPVGASTGPTAGGSPRATGVGTTPRRCSAHGRPSHRAARAAIPTDAAAGVQLIAYADRLGGTLDGLKDVMDGPLGGAFSGVHILPFYTPYDGADAGFDPVDHTAVDPRLGSWADVAAIGRDYTVMADMIVNHMSADSPEFRDDVARGAESPHMGMPAPASV